MSITNRALGSKPLYKRSSRGVGFELKGSGISFVRVARDRVFVLLEC